ncbi:hypothetical protein [Rubinisphaera sp.]|uniref:hypothetical protein n=1 Tax=Rubinisphaera sp. TaxID=2024857 RepID=UPI000C10B745|nr:hypothetical protein [Rubinisphaera sp.]MBV07801.1 hypothetical protein [Rubinisphaera sp.]HCS50949.1 hypothetical protein [Planctomycetaceae bacterium]
MEYLTEKEFLIINEGYRLAQLCIKSIIESQNESCNYKARMFQYQDVRDARTTFHTYIQGDLIYEIRNLNWYFNSITSKQYSFSGIFGERVINSAIKTAFDVANIFDSICMDAWMDCKSDVPVIENVTNYESYDTRVFQLEMHFIFHDERKWLDDYWETLLPFLESLGIGVEKWKNSLSDWSFSLSQLHADLLYEHSIVCREHLIFYRKYLSEINSLNEENRERVLARWKMKFDSKEKIITRRGFNTPVALSPRAFNLFMELLDSIAEERNPNFTYDNHSDWDVKAEKKPVKGNIRTIASELRSSLKVLGMTLSSDGKYTIKELPTSRY